MELYKVLAMKMRGSIIFNCDYFEEANLLNRNISLVRWDNINSHPKLDIKYSLKDKIILHFQAFNTSCAIILKPSFFSSFEISLKGKKLTPQQYMYVKQYANSLLYTDFKMEEDVEKWEVRN